MIIFHSSCICMNACLLTLVYILYTTILSTSTVQAKQLKDYENQVIAKRLEELDDDEIQALVEDIERDDF